MDKEKSMQGPEMEDIETGKIEEIHQPDISNDQQKRVRHAFDKRVLPIVCVLYVLSYLDRGNIGNAKTAGAQKDLGLNSQQWSWVLYSLYIGYELFEWTTLFWKIFPAHIYVTFLCVGWGTAAICSGVVTNLAGLCICRAFLGIFEVMLATGSPFYLSMFYQRKELGLRMAFLLGTAPLANCFASALAFGITHIKHSWEPWRWLFVIEGVPTLLFAPVVFFFLPDSPTYAKFLSEEDQTLAIERIQMRDTVAKNKVVKKHLLLGLTDWKTWVHAAIQFCWNYSFASLSNFLPTIINSMGYTSITAQGLTAPPYFAAFLCCVVVALVSDRWGKRGPLIAVLATISLIGYLILTTVSKEISVGARYVGVWFACCGTFPIVALNLTWILNNAGNDSKKGSAVAVVAIVGQLTSFIGSSVFPDKDAPAYKLGSGLGCAFSGLIVILSLLMHFLLEKENERRDALHGLIFEGEVIDISDLGDEHPKYRYLT